MRSGLCGPDIMATTTDISCDREGEADGELHSKDRCALYCGRADSHWPCLTQRG